MNVSAATKDLPDPLDPTPTMAVSNPDDLLAQMADEAIDRLMADADNGAMPTAPPVPMEEVAPEGPAASVAAAAEPPVQAVEAPPEPAEARTVADTASVAPYTADVSAADPLPAAVVNETSPASEKRALLGDPPPARPSLLLLPLRVVNAPFAGLGDDARRIIGLLGIVTLVPTVIAFVYLYWLKHH